MLHLRMKYTNNNNLYSLLAPHLNLYTPRNKTSSSPNPHLASSPKPNPPGIASSEQNEGSNIRDGKIEKIGEIILF